MKRTEIVKRSQIIESWSMQLDSRKNVDVDLQ